MFLNRYIYLFCLLLLFLVSKAFSQDNIAAGIKTYLLSDTLTAKEYYNKGKLLSGQGKYDSSNVFYNNAIKIYKSLADQTKDEEYWVSLISSSNAVGWNLMMLGKYDSSLTLLENTLNLGKFNLGDNHPEVAQSYNNIGTVFWYEGKYDKALEMYQNSLKIKSQVYGESSGEVAVTLNNLGLTYHKKGEYDKALSSYHRSLDIRVSILGENHSLVAANYNNIGNVYLLKGDYEKALENQLKALSIRLSSLGENNPDVATSYNNIGIIYGSLGDYDKEIEFYQKALSIRLNLFGENHPGVAIIYGNMGTVYDNKRDFHKALEYYNKALTIRKKLSGEENPSVALIYNNMGDTYRLIKEFDKSFEYLNKSLELRLKLMGSNHPDVAITYSNLGNVYYDINDYHLAREYYLKSLSIWSNQFGGKHPEVGLAYYNIARTYLQQNNFDSALFNCHKSIVSLVNDFDDTNIFSYPKLDYINSELNLLKTLKLKANIFSLQEPSVSNEYLKHSLKNYELASDLVDKIRLGYKSEGSKILIGEQVLDLFSEAVKVSLDLYSLTNDDFYRQSAFRFIEKSKSAVLHEGVLESKAKEFANLPQQIINKEKELKTNISFNITELQKEIQKGDLKDSSKVNEFENNLFSLKNEYDQFIYEIEKNYPSYYNLKYQVNIKSISEIQHELKDNDLILEYFLSDESIYIACISKESFDIIEVAKPQNLNELVVDFYTSIIKSETAKYVTAANRLTDLLITPVSTVLNTIEKIIIIPHDILFKVPFEALFASVRKNWDNDFTKLDYLIKSYDILYHYSATLFTNSLNEKANKNYDNNYFIGFAPVFPDTESSGYTLRAGESTNDDTDSTDSERALFIDGKRFGELKYSEWEVKSIMEILDKQENKKFSTAYFFNDATKKTFKEKIQDFRVVHIASHSFINEDYPAISGVAFMHSDDSDNFDDGILYAAETYNLEMNAELLVLSSCESGLGKLVRGEGMMALARGFMYSGTANLIFSLWKVPDKHTSELMVEFYRQMISGKTYSESLRAAKLKLIGNQLTARPRSWAGFLLIGSD